MENAPEAYRQDPSSLTTAQLYREIGALSDIQEARLLALTERLTSSELASKEALTQAADAIQRGLDKAEKTLKEALEHLTVDQKVAVGEVEDRLIDQIKGLRTALDEKLNHARELSHEKFNTVQIQFGERDKRVDQLSEANRAAIDAALTAQKDASQATNESNAAAIAKSEVGFTKQFDQIGASIVSSNKSVDEKIDDLKTRMDRGEGKSTGSDKTWVTVLSVIGALIALASLVVVLVRK